MAILQFAFGNDPQAPDFKPHNYPHHLVAYTGTHDNDTVVGWWNSKAGAGSIRTEADVEKEQAYAKRYLNTDGHDINLVMIRTLMASVADTVLFPLQDVLGVGSEGRMNLPGSSSGNWRWRFRGEQLQASFECATETVGGNLRAVASCARARSRFSLPEFSVLQGNDVPRQKRGAQCTSNSSTWDVWPMPRICSALTGKRQSLTRNATSRSTSKPRRSKGLQIRYIFETHLHADFVSGHNELAARTGANIYVGKAAEASYPHIGVVDGSEVHVGRCRVDVIATPGHTLESLCLLLTDEEKSQTPFAVLTGDTLFIGDVGRPGPFENVHSAAARGNALRLAARS